MSNRHLRLECVCYPNFTETVFSITNFWKLWAQEKPSMSAPANLTRTKNSESAMNKSAFRDGTNSRLRNKKFTPVHINFKVVRHQYQSPLILPTWKENMAPEIFTPLTTTYGDPWAPHESVDAEAAAAKDLEKVMKFWTELYPQIRTRRKAVRIIIPITSTRRFKKPGTSSLAVDNHPEMCALLMRPLMCLKRKLVLFSLTPQEVFYSLCKVKKLLNNIKWQNWALLLGNWGFLVLQTLVCCCR